MKYAIIRTHKREGEERYHVMMALFNEDYVFDYLVDAIIARSKCEYPEDFIIIPFY